MKTFYNENQGKVLQRKTRAVMVGDLQIGGGAPVSIQSMCATKTQNIEATLRQVQLLEEHQTDVIRIAIDSKADVEALKIIRPQTKARIVIDLQENYRLISLVAPFVQKVRYNPGHLHHHEKEVPVQKKVAFLVETAREYNLALRIGVNFGSLDPSQKANNSEDRLEAAISSASEHVG